jgi:alginate O-acetyltransferase complex protein AlgI
MLFTEPGFLYLLVPLLALTYWWMPLLGRNLLLLTVGVLFYWWGEKLFVVMLASIALNWLFGLGVDRERFPRAARWFLGFGIAANLGLLGVYKYANFAVDSLNQLLGAAGMAAIPWQERIHLPIGISFFAFQGVSYLLDVWWGIAKRSRSPLVVGLYISLFPHMIAGPIVKYKEIVHQLLERHLSWEDVHTGLRRFLIGLAKKVLIANGVAHGADLVMAAPAGELSAAAAWLGLLCYAIQLYFDFSGYSDMAIGVARMLGFRIPENFNHPYVARSITGLWQRWHMTLSTWLRDYLFFPLAGRRPSPQRTKAALFTVFLACGLWHGASWNFVLWGAWNGLFLVLERSGFGPWLERRPAAVAWGYAMAVWLAGLVLFRCTDLGHAGGYFAALAGAGGAMPAAAFWDRQVLLCLGLGLVASLPVVPWLAARRDALAAASPARAPLLAGAWAWSRTVWLAALFALCSLLCAAGAYNPFLYFQF